MTTAGVRVRRARIRAKLTQTALAARASVGRSWLVSVETDRIKTPDANKLRRVAAELGLDYRELLSLTNQLGEVFTPAPTTGADAAAITAAITAQTTAIEKQTEVLERVLGLLNRADSGLVRWLAGLAEIEPSLTGRDSAAEPTPRAAIAGGAAPPGPLP